MKAKDNEVNKLTTQIQTLSNDILNNKLSKMELEHDSKSSKSKNSELINEIEMYKNELDDIKTKCSYLSNEVQSTHRQVVEAKSDLEKKDRVLANKDAELKLEVDGFVPTQC